MDLRPYQHEAIDAMLGFYLRPKQRGLVVLPTASGKTIIFCQFIQYLLARYPDTHVLMLGHTQEIVAQNEDKLLRIWPDAPVGVYCSGLERHEINQVTSASRDSIARLVDEFPRWDLVIIDEAHLITAEDSGRYQTIMRQAKLNNPRVKFIGFTATPFRSRHGYLHDKAGLNLFDEVIYHKRIDELTQATYLCPVRAVAVRDMAVADTSKVRQSVHDFMEKDLVPVTIKDSVVFGIVHDWCEKTSGKLPTVFFAASLQQAKKIQQELARRGFDYPLIQALTPKNQRALWIEQFEQGELGGLINYATLTTGWDSPRMACIVMARPTLSPGLFLQVVGRGLRTATNKTETLLLDYGQNLARFGTIERVRPESEDRSRFFTQSRIQTCPTCETLVSVFAAECPHCTQSLELPERYSECGTCGAYSDYFATCCEVCGESFFDN